MVVLNKFWCAGEKGGGNYRVTEQKKRVGGKHSPRICIVIMPIKKLIQSTSLNSHDISSLSVAYLVSRRNHFLKKRSKGSRGVWMVLELGDFFFLINQDTWLGCVVFCMSGPEKLGGGGSFVSFPFSFKWLIKTIEQTEAHSMNGCLDSIVERQVLHQNFNVGCRPNSPPTRCPQPHRYPPHPLVVFHKSPPSVPLCFCS